MYVVCFQCDVVDGIVDVVEQVQVVQVVGVDDEFVVFGVLGFQWVFVEVDVQVVCVDLEFQCVVVVEQVFVLGFV